MYMHYFIVVQEAEAAEKRAHDEQAEISRKLYLASMQTTVIKDSVQHKEQL